MFDFHIIQHKVNLRAQKETHSKLQRHEGPFRENISLSQQNGIPWLHQALNENIVDSAIIVRESVFQLPLGN